MTHWLDRVDVVLARPEGALNVGSCCRAMKSMGLQSLILAAAREMRDDEVFTMALHARDVYERARRCDDLESALAGTVLSAGITRRRGAKRKWFSLLPEQLAERAAATASGRVALVFGNERDGLSDEELARCTLACHIPSSPEFPSLNLSHAVQLTASAFWRRSIDGRRGGGPDAGADGQSGGGRGAGAGGYHPIDREAVDNLTAVIHGSLEAMNYFRSADPLHTDRFFRDILTRAALSVREARHLEKIFRKLHYLKAGGAEDE